MGAREKLWELEGKCGAAELSSSELQHCVLRPCWTTARTTQQQTQRIDSLFLPLLFCGSRLLCASFLCPLLLIYSICLTTGNRWNKEKPIDGFPGTLNRSLLIKRNEGRIKTWKIQSRSEQDVVPAAFEESISEHNTEPLTDEQFTSCQT